jgi:hypothetical protein
MSRILISFLIASAIQAQAAPQDHPGNLIARCAHYTNPELYSFGSQGRVLALSNLGKYGTIIPQGILENLRLGGALANTLPQLPKDFFGQQALFFFANCINGEGGSLITRCKNNPANFIRLVGRNSAGTKLTFEFRPTSTQGPEVLNLDLPRIENTRGVGYSILLKIIGQNLTGPAQTAFQQLSDHISESRICQ